MRDHPESIATLMVSCPDRHGLVAALAQFLTAHNANIVHAEQHRDADTNLFFQRVQFDVSEMRPERQVLHDDLRILADTYQMTWTLHYGDYVPRMAIFVSKVEHCLYDLLLRQKSRELRCAIPLVISNHERLRKVAQHFEIPFHYVPVTSANRATAEQQQLELLAEYRVDIVALARYMQILSPQFIAQYPYRIINIHHSFLPAFAGGKPYHQALEHGVKLIGATSHYVTAELDTGPIIEQDVVRVSHRDSLHNLIARGRDVEQMVLARAIKAHLEHRVAVCGSKTIVFG
ncbi:MAG: formyltetrahydrofolate deformylase [Planctomycetota bacterium]